MLSNEVGSEFVGGSSSDATTLNVCERPTDTWFHVLIPEYLHQWRLARRVPHPIDYGDGISVPNAAATDVFMRLNRRSAD